MEGIGVSCTAVYCHTIAPAKRRVMQAVMTTERVSMEAVYFIAP
jgi:hypothetical protein